MKPLSQDDDKYEFASVDDEVMGATPESDNKSQENDYGVDVFSETAGNAPAMTGDSREMDFWPIEQEAPSVNTRGTVMVMLMILCAGAAGVWYFHRDIGPLETSAVDREIENKVNTFMRGEAERKRVGAELADIDAASKLVAVFSKFSDSMVTENQEAYINPFTLRGERAQKQSEDKDQEFLKRALLAELRFVNLGGVMEMGKSSTAIINGDVVRIGDSLGRFTVTDIKDNSVQLQHEQFVFIISNNSERP